MLTSNFILRSVFYRYSKGLSKHYTQRKGLTVCRTWYGKKTSFCHMASCKYCKAQHFRDSIPLVLITLPCSNKSNNFTLLVLLKPEELQKPLGQRLKSAPLEYFFYVAMLRYVSCFLSCQEGFFNVQ